MKHYLKEFRYSQWIKNLVVYLPLFFGSGIFNFDLLIQATIAFVMFSGTASLVYVINDIRDLDEDKRHPDKKHRPLASGKIKKNEILAVRNIMLVLFILIILLIDSVSFKIVLVSYFLINILYSLKLKRFPIVEMLIVSTCYILRLIGGGVVTGIDISPWLYLLIFAGSMLFVGGKRLSEKRYTNVRYVLQFYSINFLRAWVIITAALAVVFMFVYSIIQGIAYIPQAIIVLFAIARYLYLLETTKRGESTEILYDKIILTLLFIFSVYSLYIIYYYSN